MFADATFFKQTTVYNFLNFKQFFVTTENIFKKVLLVYVSVSGVTQNKILIFFLLIFFYLLLCTLQLNTYSPMKNAQQNHRMTQHQAIYVE